MDKTSLGLKRALVEIGVISLAINLLVLVMPLYLLQVYERVLPSTSYDTLIFLTILAIAAIALHGILDAIRSHFAARIATRVDARLSGPALSHVVDPPVEEVKAGRVGDVGPMRDLVQLRGFMASKLFLAFFDLPFVPIFLGILYLIQPALFWLTAAGVVVLLLLAALTQSLTRAPTQAATGAGRTAMNRAQEVLRQVELVRAMGMKDNVTRWWGEGHGEELSHSDRASRRTAWLGGIARAMRIMLQVGILGLGAYLVLQGEMTAGMIFASSLIAGRALQPIDQMIGGWKNIVDGASCMKRVIEARKRQRDEPDYVALDNPGQIEVEQLVYHAPGAQPGTAPILKGLSVTVPPGRMIALMGPSGAGKSTLMRLLTGAIAPGSGAVRFDGAELSQWNRAALGRRIGYLPQDVEFLTGTIAANIARFAPNPSMEEVQIAAERAGATRAILDLPAGFDTMIGPGAGGPGAARLSGGEAQRVALARALFGDPKFVFLDEPHAHADADGEAALLAALKGAQERGATIVVSTHKPDLARRFDAVLLLEGGTIRNYGTPATVLDGGSKPTTAPAKATARRAAKPGLDTSGWAKPTAVPKGTKADVAKLSLKATTPRRNKGKGDTT